MSQRRIHTPTAEESARWRKAVEEELRAKPENIARARRYRAALAEQSVAGQLRRAMVESRLDMAQIEQQADVAHPQLVAFLRGEAPLDSDAFGRVARALGYALAPSVRA